MVEPVNRMDGSVWLELVGKGNQLRTQMPHAHLDQKKKSVNKGLTSVPWKGDKQLLSLEHLTVRVKRD